MKKNKLILYPKISLRLPKDLNDHLKKEFNKRGELSKALVLIIKEAVHEKGRITRIRKALLQAS